MPGPKRHELPTLAQAFKEWLDNWEEFTVAPRRMKPLLKPIDSKQPKGQKRLWLAQRRLWHWLLRYDELLEELAGIHGGYPEVFEGVIPIDEARGAARYLRAIIQASLPAVRCPRCIYAPPAAGWQCICGGRGWLTLSQQATYKFTPEEQKLQAEAFEYWLRVQRERLARDGLSDRRQHRGDRRGDPRLSVPAVAARRALRQTIRREKIRRATLDRTGTRTVSIPPAAGIQPSGTPETQPGSAGVVDAGGSRTSNAPPATAGPENPAT